MDCLRHVLSRGSGNASQVNRGPSGLSHCRAEACRLSSSQHDRNADQRHADGDHREARTPERIPAHEQHRDRDRIGEAQRPARVADQNEGDYNREGRYEAE